MPPLGLVAAEVLPFLAHFGDVVLDGPFEARLACCALSPAGDLFVAFATPRTSIDVAVGDTFAAGVSFTWLAGREHLDVAPRLLRLVCGNGQILPADPTLASRTFQWRLVGGAQGRMEAAVEDGLSGRVLRPVAARIRSAGRPAPEAVMRLLAGPTLGLGPFWIPTVARALREEGDHTPYGLLNALTRSARDARDPGDRIRLEGAAGRLIARFGSPELEPPRALAAR